jgi:hypothetical protein
MSTPRVNLNKEIIALFSGQASQVTTPKLYIELTGSHSLAIILNQAVFWSNKSKSKDGFFHKTYEEWFEEIHIPERTLRRRFDTLEMNGWISTKVKKINGKNTKHVLAHIDKIIESISIMLDSKCPIRPDCPDKPNIEQKPCTKSAPTGQIGRSEPAKLADSTIRTEEYLQKKLTNCASSSSFFFSETLDRQMLNEKLLKDERSDDEFLTEVKIHIEERSDLSFSLIIRQQAALKLLRKLKKLNEVFFVSGNKKNEPKKIIETPEQRAARYKLEREKNSYLK